MSDPFEKPQQPSKPDPEIIPVIATREEGAPPLPLPEARAEIPPEPSPEPLPDPLPESPPDIPFEQPELTRHLEQLDPSPAIACETAPEPELVDEEIRAAKWYSIGFLVVISILSIVGLAVMLFVTVKMFDAVMR